MEDNVKSSVPLALTGILCILIAGCTQVREANVSTPPAASYQVTSFELQRSAGNTQKVRGASVTPLFFQNEEMPTFLGRGFLPEEYSPASPQVVLISHRLWQQGFAGDPKIIGNSVRLDGRPRTVVGIMPATFDVPSGVDIWVPKTG